MDNLPYEVNITIFKQLDKKSLNNCLFVNKSFSNIIYKLIWHTISLKNVKIISKIWFENEENKNTNLSNVVKSNLMFPYHEAVTVIECSFLNSLTYDMERIINSCKNVKYIIYHSSVIEKPLLKFQRPLYKWELENISKNKYNNNNNYMLLKKIDKSKDLENFSNEWDEKTITIDDYNAETDINKYSQSTENEDEMSIILNSIEQEFENSNEIINITNNNNTYDNNIKVNENNIGNNENNESNDINNNNDNNIHDNISNNNVNGNSIQMSDINSISSSQIVNNSSMFSSSNTYNNCNSNSLRDIPYPILSNLVVIDFSNSCISPEVLGSFIENCNSLEEIIFIKNDISDKILQQFMKSKSLKYLHIDFEITSWDDEFTYEGFTNFIDFCSEKLYKFYIHSLKLLDNEMINYLINYCPKNIYSIVFDSPNISSQEISSFIKQSSHLKELIIGSLFSKSTISKLPFDFRILYPEHELISSSMLSVHESNNYYNSLIYNNNNDTNSNYNYYINNNNNNSNDVSLSFDFINHLLSKSKNVQWLRNLTKFEYHFEKMNNDNFDIFIAIVKEMKNLEYLKLSGDVNFTNKNIYDLLFNLRNLKSLQLWIYNSSYNFNHITIDNTNREKNINNSILSDHIFNLINTPNYQHHSLQYSDNKHSTSHYLSLSSIYSDSNFIEIHSPFAFTSEIFEILAGGICPKLTEISGYFSTDVLPNQLQKTINKLSYLNNIFMSNFQFDQNNELNSITDDYQSQWKTFVNQFKESNSSESSISHLNELDEILISSHRIVLSFNKDFILRLKTN